MRPAAAQHLDCEVVVRRGQAVDGAEPVLEMRALVRVAQQASAVRAQRGDRIERAEPEDAVRADAPAARHEPIEHREEFRARLDRAAEALRQRAADLLHARMHVLRDVDELAILQPNLAPHARGAGGAGLEVGDADDVVIGHRVGDVLGGGGREGVRRGVIQGGERRQPVEIFVSVGEILKVDDLAQARLGHRPRL